MSGALTSAFQCRRDSRTTQSLADNLVRKDFRREYLVKQKIHQDGYFSKLGGEKYSYKECMTGLAQSMPCRRVKVTKAQRRKGTELKKITNKEGLLDDRIAGLLDYWIGGLIRLRRINGLLRIKELCKSHHMGKIRNAYSEFFFKIQHL